MISLEKYGDTTYVDWSKSTPNSLSNGIVIELRWTFIEMRERRNFFRTKYDKLAHFMKSIFIGDEDLDLGIYYEMKDGTKIPVCLASGRRSWSYRNVKRENLCESERTKGYKEIICVCVYMAGRSTLVQN